TIYHRTPEVHPSQKQVILKRPLGVESSPRFREAKLRGSSRGFLRQASAMHGRRRHAQRSCSSPDGEMARTFERGVIHTASWTAQAASRCTNAGETGPHPLGNSRAPCRLGLLGTYRSAAGGRAIRSTVTLAIGEGAMTDVRSAARCGRGECARVP